MGSGNRVEDVFGRAALQSVWAQWPRLGIFWWYFDILILFWYFDQPNSKNWSSVWLSGFCIYLSADARAWQCVDVKINISPCINQGTEPSETQFVTLQVPERAAVICVLAPVSALMDGVMVICPWECRMRADTRGKWNFSGVLGVFALPKSSLSLLT